MLPQTPPHALTLANRAPLRIRGQSKPTAKTWARRHEAATRRREFLDLRGVANAAKHLDHLPRPGCTIHGVMRGHYSYCDLVPAVLRLASPATLDYCAVTTLGFGRRAQSTFVTLLDSSALRSVDFLVAAFFERAEQTACADLRQALQRRGSRFASARCHAKVLLLSTTDNRHYVSESSANIRACRSIEQFALTEDRDLFAFHRAWIEELMAAYAEREKAA